MNLNKKIVKFTGDGIPAYNAKINELIDAVNWIAGIRTIYGKPIAESDQGPVIDLSQANSTQPLGNQPWLTDPNGNPAGWTKVKIFDPSGQRFIDDWVWTGVGSDAGTAPWIQDPSQVTANWVVCVDNTFWGTGKCPTGPTCVNYRAGSFDTAYPYPNTVTYTTGGSNIVPPSACTPRFYVTAPQIANQGFIGPCFAVGGYIPGSFTYTLTITYDGVTVFSVSGSGTCTPVAGAGNPCYIPMPESGWIYDPGGLPGYSQGSGYWIWQFNGTASTNLAPQIVITFTYSSSTSITAGSPWNVVFMQGT